MEEKLVKRKAKHVEDQNYAQLGEACRRLGDYYHEQCEYVKALGEYKLEADACKNVGNKMGFGRAHRMIGEMYMLLEKFEDALKHENFYMNTAKNEKNIIEEQRAYATIGRAYLLQGQSSEKEDTVKSSLKSAEKYFLKSLLVCKRLSGQVGKSELSDMQARLFLNLGVVKEHQENFEESLQYIEKSICICKSNDLYELLHQCYFSLALSYNHKQNNTTQAFKYLNVALEIASRLHNKTTKACETLIVKAEIMIKMGDYQSAKSVLKQAYRLKTPVTADNNLIAKKLKNVIAICKVEDELILTNSDNYEKKKILYEKMGDGSCKLQNYSKAIEYYKKMLENAEKNGDSEKEIVPIYVSLYQTYKDNQQYAASLQYLWMEYALIKNEPKEAFNTYLNIAEIYEVQKKTFWDIERMYVKAKEEALKINNTKLEKIVLRKTMELFKSNGMDIMAEGVVKEAKDKGILLEDHDSDSDDSDKSIHDTPDISGDICLDDLSESEAEEEADKSIEPPRQSRRRGTSFAIKKNVKGETQLHQACISGNKLLVQKLLEQGHPVNIRDHAGWIPLHEACIHGHLDIVEMLIDRGANINDKGGTCCDGISPLYDACSNGNLEIVELLLDRGANANLLTDFGDTTANILQKWHEKYGQNLSDEEVLFYTKIKNRLIQNLEQTGVLSRLANNVQCSEVDSSKSLENEIERNSIISSRRPRLVRKFYEKAKSREHAQTSSSSDSDCDPPSHKLKTPIRINQTASPITSYNVSATPGCSNTIRKEPIISGSKKIGRLRHQMSSESEDDSDGQNSASPNVDNYKSAINVLRNRNKYAEISVADKAQKRLAHLELDEVDDDWLIDDLAPTKKKQRTLPEPVQLQPISDEIINSTIHSSDEENDNPDAFNILMKNAQSSFRGNKSKNRSNLSVRRDSYGSRKSQSSLLDSGFSVSRSATPIAAIEDGVSIRSYDDNSVTTPNTPAKYIPMPSPMKAIQPNLINIKIDNETVTVIVSHDDINCKTIDWLSKEAAKKYSFITAQLPKLVLLRSDGIPCEIHDPLTSVMKGRSVIDSIVIGWNETSLRDRVEVVSSEMGCDMDDLLLSALSLADETNSFTLPKDLLSYSKAKLKVLFRTLKYCKSLKELNLEMNMIDDDDIRYLAEILPTLLGLKKLNLQNNFITFEGISQLSSLLFESMPRALSELIELDLSYNPLYDDSLLDLFMLCNSLGKLRVLKLNRCDLSTLEIDNHQLFLHNLTNFEIIGNNFNKTSIDYIFKNLTATNIFEFDLKIFKDINFNAINTMTKFFNTGERFALQKLDLSNCKLKDCDLLAILNALTNCQCLRVIDVSWNDNLSSLALEYLLKNMKFFALDFIHLNNCPRVLQNVDVEFVNQVAFDLESKIPRRIHLSCSCNENKERESDVARMLWRKLWAELGQVEINKLELKLFVQ